MRKLWKLQKFREIKTFGIRLHWIMISRRFFVKVKFYRFHTENSLYWIFTSEIWYISLSNLVSKIPETEKGEKGFFFFEENYIFAFPFQVKQNLVAAIPGSQVSFPFFMAFISLLSNIELIKKIYLNATNGSRTIEITKGSLFNCKIIVRFNYTTSHFQRNSYIQLKWCHKLLPWKLTFCLFFVIFYIKQGRYTLKVAFLHNVY